MVDRPLERLSLLIATNAIKIECRAGNHSLSLHPTMPQADGMILAKEEESDAEVRREDQDRINEFGELNARLYEVRSEVKKLKVSVSEL